MYSFIVRMECAVHIAAGSLLIQELESKDGGDTDIHSEIPKYYLEDRELRY